MNDSVRIVFRTMVSVLILAGLEFIAVSEEQPVMAEIRATWSNGDPDNSLADPHLLGAATRLGNGKVIAAGGLDRKLLGLAAIQVAELYDPHTNRWTKTGDLNVARWSLDAVSLPNGKALFAGGAAAFSPAPPLDTAEVYDPESGQFTLTKNTLSVGRQGFGVSLLSDGQVLLSGGNTTGNNLGGSGSTAVDIYDPTTNEFHTAAPLHEGRAQHAQVTLRDGRVVVIGGAQSTSEIYDPQKNSWTLLADKLPTTLKDMKAFETPDGNVFIAGGQNTVDGVTTDATWFLDPNSGQLTLGPSMAGFHGAASGTQVGVSDYSAFDLFPADHKWHGRYLLFAGGEHDPLVGPDIEYDSACLFDVTKNRFLNIGPMPFIHDDHTESMLGINSKGNPEVLLFGGNSTPGTSRFELDVSSVME